MKNVCGAKTRKGTPCKRAPMPNGRCRLHGGLSLKGAESPTFKHGKQSKYMPQRLLRIYEDIEQDEETTILSRNIRLRETFIREKLAMIDDVPDSAETWANLRSAWDSLKIAFANENLGLVHHHMTQVERLIDEREAYHKTVAELRSDMAEQRKDKQAMASIEFKGENAIPIKELMALMGGILHIVQTVVTDNRQRIEIANGIDKLLIGQASPIETEG